MSIYVPSIAAPYLLKELGSRLVIGKLADDISRDIPDIEWSGNAIVFPVFTRTAVASNIEAKGSVTPSEIDGDSTSAPVEHIAAATKWHKDVVRTSGRRLADMGLRDLADAMSLKLDGDVMSAAISGATLRCAAAAADKLTQDELEAGFALFGDKQAAEEFSGILIHSKLFPSVLAMPGFTSTAVTYTQNSNGIVKGQVAGFYRGVPIYLTNNGNYISESGTYECKTILLKKGGLAYAMKQGIEFCEDYNNTTFYTTVTADTYAAAKVVDTDKIVLIAKEPLKKVAHRG